MVRGQGEQAPPGGLEHWRPGRDAATPALGRDRAAIQHSVSVRNDSCTGAHGGTEHGAGLCVPLGVRSDVCTCKSAFIAACTLGKHRNCCSLFLLYFSYSLFLINFYVFKCVRITLKLLAVSDCPTSLLTAHAGRAAPVSPGDGAPAAAALAAPPPGPGEPETGSRCYWPTAALQVHWEGHGQRWGAAACSGPVGPATPWCPAGCGSCPRVIPGPSSTTFGQQHWDDAASRALKDFPGATVTQSCWPKDGKSRARGARCAVCTAGSCSLQCPEEATSPEEAVSQAAGLELPPWREWLYARRYVDAQSPSRA